MEKKDTLFNKGEKAGAVTVIVLIILRLLVGTMMNYALLIVTTLLAVYYLWFGFFIFNKLQPLDLLNKHALRSLSHFRVAISISMGIVISYALIASLFGMFFYPGIDFMLRSSFILLVAFTGYLVSYQVRRKKSYAFLRHYYVRAASLAIILLLLWLPPLEERLDILFGDHPEFVEAYLEYNENPDHEDAIEKLREERSRFR